MPVTHSSGTRQSPSIAIVQQQDKRSTKSKTKRSRHPPKVAQPGRTSRTPSARQFKGNLPIMEPGRCPSTRPQIVRPSRPQAFHHLAVRPRRFSVFRPQPPGHSWPQIFNHSTVWPEASKVFALWLQPLDHSWPRALGHSSPLMLGHSASLTFGRSVATARPSVASSVPTLCLIDASTPSASINSAFCGLERPAFCLIDARPSVASSVPAFCLIDVRSLALGHAWHVRPLALGHAWPHVFKHSTVWPFATSSFPTFSRSASHVFGPSTSTAWSSWAFGVKTFGHSASTLGYTWSHVFKHLTVPPFDLIVVRPLGLNPFGLNRSAIRGLKRSSILPHCRSAARPQPLRPQSIRLFVASSIQHSASLTLGHTWPQAFQHSASLTFGL
ncbi:hypothetical protein LR48_Vigan08g017500 [Vigna angularis]|uniref:Uncharacterized protein n=1 Tax=Phaseolus angularis TaxID=3914 RepID=A0A0L9V2T0_PHAAN|nr:hypothetical protein LR48_Vigan08g017500 [Vigna angularis]